jgi:hypothetical protein
MGNEPGLKQDHESIFYEIKTREQGIGYLEELVDHLNVARGEMDRAQLVRVKQKAFHNLLIRYGRALGALTTLMHVRIFENADYDRFAPRIHGAIVPRVVAEIRS